MLITFLTAVACMIVISGCWLAVQRLWWRQFSENDTGEGDALAGRSGCRGCNCTADHCEGK